MSVCVCVRATVVVCLSCLLLRFFASWIAEGLNFLEKKKTRRPVFFFFFFGVVVVVVVAVCLLDFLFLTGASKGTRGSTGEYHTTLATGTGYGTSTSASLGGLADLSLM